MTDDVYYQLARVLDTLPNGFPSTDSGVEIKILKKIFTPEEADLFCDLKLTFETAQQIAERTGRQLEHLEEMLVSMWQRGEVFGFDMGGVKIFKMMPWVLGIYEFQLKRMDREFAKLNEEYSSVFGKQFFKIKPQYFQSIPVEKGVTANQQALPYEQVSKLIENSQSFALAECICKKQKGLLDQRCDKPLEVCLAFAPIPGAMENFKHWGKVITKEEAFNVLKKSEEAGLVHLTVNWQSGHNFICNCCSCCCGVLRSINELGITDAINSNHYAQIDPEMCEACGICKEERCPVGAIEEQDNVYRVIRQRCIGCGVCVSTCPTEAIQLYRKLPEELVPTPQDEKAWLEERARKRGVNYNAFQ